MSAVIVSKKILITGLRFFCIFIAIFIDSEQGQTLVYDTPRDSLCKIFILLQEYKRPKYWKKR